MSVPVPYLLRSGTSGRSLVLNLDPELFREFPDLVQWDGTTLRKKSEFHVTLLQIRIASELVREPLEGFESKVENFFHSFIKEKPIEVVSFLDDFRYAEKEEKKTIVVRCTVSNLNEFFVALNRAIHIDMPTQPTHVTLYTLQKNIGIHVPDDRTMEDLERVHLPELDAALKSVKIL